MDHAFAARVERYFVERLGAVEPRVTGARRLFEGISRETWLIQMNCAERPSSLKGDGFVLRLDPAYSLLPSGRSSELAVYSTLEQATGIPVPGLVANEDNPDWLGAPFIAIDLLPGTAQPAQLLSTAHVGAGPMIARQSFAILGRIAALPCQALGLCNNFEMPTQDSAWQVALDYWEGQLRDNPIGSLPVTMGAIRRMRRYPPPPAARISLVHGDFRLGNYLFDRNEVTGILDWEMAHLGDPVEDLAWSLLGMWRFASSPGKIAHFLTPDEAIGAWEAASGLTLDHRSLGWWTLLGHVKLVALGAMGAHGFAKGGTSTLEYALGAWAALPAQESYILEHLEALSA